MNPHGLPLEEEADFVFVLVPEGLMMKPSTWY
jgi:hypothetical protein